MGTMLCMFEDFIAFPCGFTGILGGFPLLKMWVSIPAAIFYGTVNSFLTGVTLANDVIMSSHVETFVSLVISKFAY